MNYEEELEKQFSNLNKENFFIHNSKHTIFVCGGKVDVTSQHVCSYRHKLFEYTANKNDKIHDALVLAENFTDYYREGNYKDLLSFEDDIASISNIVVIMLESNGALVELGLYCSRKKYADKLIVVSDEDVQDKNNDSFIALGPLKFIASQKSAKVLNHQFPKKSNNFESDIEDLCFQIEEKLQAINSRERFNAEIANHVPFLIVEFIRIAHPIQLKEIINCLKFINEDIDSNKLKQILYVLEVMKFIKKIKKSDNFFYFPCDQRLKFSTFGKLKNGKVFSDVDFMTIIKDCLMNDDSVMSKRRLSALKKYQRDQ